MGKAVGWKMVLKAVPTFTNNQWRSLKWQLKTHMIYLKRTILRDSDARRKNFPTTPIGDNKDIIEQLDNLSRLFMALIKLGNNDPRNRHKYMMSLRSIYKDDILNTGGTLPFGRNIDEFNARKAYKSAKADNPTQTPAGQDERMDGIPVLDKHAYLDKSSAARQQFAKWLDNPKHDEKCCRTAKLSWLRTRRPRISKRPGGKTHPIMEQDCHDFLTEMLATIEHEATSKGDRDAFINWWYCEDLTAAQRKGGEW